MDTSVVVGLIAATASVSSVLANIYIAARTRKSALEALRFKADLDKRDGIAKSIKEIEVEGERLRIKCWQLVFWCNSGTNFRSDDVLFTDQISEFVKQSDVFLDRWANTKTELPLGTVEMLRAIRHNSRHLIEEVRIQAARCTKSKHLPGEELRQLVEVIQDLLRALDSFTKMVCEVRRGMLSGSITEETESQFFTRHGYSEDQSL